MRSLLSNRSFVCLLAGRLVTNAGDSLYYVAAMWLTYELTGSTFFTGLVGTLTLIPQAFQFLAGPFVDRWRLGRLLVRTQLLQGALVLIIPLVAITGHLTVWVLIVVMPLLSICNQFVYPAHNTALPRIVDEDELVEANSMLAVTYQGVDAVFMAAGGILVALVGASVVFVVDSITFAVAAMLFSAATIPHVSSTDDGVEVDEADEDDDAVESAVADYGGRLRDGFAFVRGSIIVPLLLGGVVVNFALGAVMAVLPAYADLLGGADTYGLLLGAVMVGMLFGSLAASPLKRFPLSQLSIVGYTISGGCWLAAIALPGIVPTALLFTIAWIPVGVTNVAFMAFVQSAIPEELVGRVISIAVSVSAAAMPLGSLLGGAGGEIVGTELVVAGLGVSFLFLAVYWSGHPLLRTFPAIDRVDHQRFGLAGAPGGE